jgi:predicted dehydrogenase
MDGRGPKPLHRIHIRGTNGSLTLENATSDYVSSFILKKDGAKVADEKQALLSDDGRIWATHQVVNRFVESIKTGKLNSPTLADGVRTEELMKWALQSSRTRQEVAI